MSRLFSFDRSLRTGEIKVLAGMDEVGRGPLAGPVVAAAVILPGDFILEGLRDSKKVRPEGRKSMVFEILSGCIDVGIGIVEAEEIDRINILEATKAAMRSAVDDLYLKPDLLLVDGLDLKGVGIESRKIIKGDDTSASIAAASIVAKEIRDGMMEAWHRVYPEYHFHKHKGYGTRLHLECLERFGPCGIHRRSFGPVRSPGLPF